MQSDLELLMEYRAGVAEAFAALVSRHIDWVYSVALRRVGDAHLAEDVTQNVFIALAADAKLHKDGAIPGWLFQTVRFASAKVVRAHGRRRWHEMAASRIRPEQNDRQEDRWGEVAPLLEDAVEQLGARDRQAILLRFYQQWSFAEVGEVMELSEEGARKRVARAIDKLRKYFARQGLAIPAASAAEIMLKNTTQSAPAPLAGAVSNQVAMQNAKDGSELLRQMRFGAIARAAGVAAILTATVLVVGAGIWMGESESKSPPLAVTAMHPADAAEPSTQTADVSFATVIAGMKRAEGVFQNLYIKNFDTTISTQAAGQTEWVATPLRYAGSAWYDADPRGKIRVYFSDEVMPWAQGAASFVRNIQDLSWNGTEGRSLVIASEMRGRGLQRMRQAMLSGDRPMLLGPYTRWETGAAFTLQYMVMIEDRTRPLQPRVPASDSFERARRAGVMPEIGRELVNGFGAVRIRFGGPWGSDTYWFDPSRGYSLVKFENRGNLPNAHWTEGWEVQRLKEIRPGIWFPIRASMIERDMQSQGGYRRYDYRAEDAVANDPHFDPAIFTVPIPTGWLVNDSRLNRKSYVTMEDGSRMETHIGSAMPSIKAGLAKRPDGNSAAIAGPAWW